MRKAEVRRLAEEYRVSQRHACELIVIPRSTVRYVSGKDDQELRDRLVELAREQPRFG